MKDSSLLVLSGAIIIVGGIGAVFAPIFFTWMGLFLRHFEPQETK